MKIFRLLSLLLISLVVVGAVAFVGAAPKGPAEGCLVRSVDSIPSCPKLFIVAVGLDLPPTTRDGVQFVSNFSESDARLLAGRLAHGARTRSRIDALVTGGLDESRRITAATTALRDTTDTLSELQVAILTGPTATKAEIMRSFAAVVRKARARDVFVFSFGGFSRSVRDSSGAGHYLAVGGLTDFGDDTQLRERGISGAEMRQWLDNIAAMRQLLILEAGDMKQFMPEFVASTVESNPTAAQLTNRERVVIVPRKFGVELPSVRAGVLAHAIATSNASALELLYYSSARQTTEIELRGYTNDLFQGLQNAAFQRAFAGEEYLRVFYERDFLELYSGVAARALRTRGLGDGAGESAVAQRLPAGRHIALLIGTDQYDARQWIPLANPVNDAQTIAAELASGFGFDTTVLRNPTREEVLQALLALKNRSYGPDDELFIFIAGHGVYDSTWNTGYLVARDSKARADDRLGDTFIPHNRLADFLTGINEHTLLVLDACFGGNFAGDLRTARNRDEGVGEVGEYANTPRSVFVADKLKHKSQLYLTSGGPGYVVSDGVPGRHSPFARRLIGALRSARSENKILTMANLRAQIEGLRPEPRAGEFGDSEPGGDFLFIPSADK